MAAPTPPTFLIGSQALHFNQLKPSKPLWRRPVDFDFAGPFSFLQSIIDHFSDVRYPMNSAKIRAPWHLTLLESGIQAIASIEIIKGLKAKVTFAVRLLCDIIRLLRFLGTFLKPEPVSH
jgi:hypothetical protein